MFLLYAPDAGLASFDLSKLSNEVLAICAEVSLFGGAMLELTLHFYFQLHELQGHQMELTTAVL